jgi:hypothetical protein
MRFQPRSDRLSPTRSGTAAGIARGIRAAKRISLVMEAIGNSESNRGREGQAP